MSGTSTAAEASAANLMASLFFWCVFAAMTQSWAAAPELEFHPPASPGDAAAPAIMRDLAERLLPVYEEADPDRYLANLFAL